MYDEDKTILFYIVYYRARQVCVTIYIIADCAFV